MARNSIQVTVIPDQIAVPSAFEAFADDGSMKDAALGARVAAVGAAPAGPAPNLFTDP